jgi:methylglutaconyl-CoA hydratase
MVMAILRRNVSEKRAFEMITLGAEFSSEEAFHLGLVNHILPDENFASGVDQFVSGFTKVSKTAVALSKRLLYHMDGLTFESALQSGVDVNAIARLTDDCQAGIAKFLTKKQKTRDD